VKVKTVNVYVVIQHVDYVGSDVLHVCGTLEEGQRVARNWWGEGAPVRESWDGEEWVIEGDIGDVHITVDKWPVELPEDL